MKVFSEAIACLTAVTKIPRPGFVVSSPIVFYVGKDGERSPIPSGMPLICVQVTLKSSPNMVCSEVAICEEELVVNTKEGLCDLLACRIENAMIDCQDFLKDSTKRRLR